MTQDWKTPPALLSALERWEAGVRDKATEYLTQGGLPPERALAAAVTEVDIMPDLPADLPGGGDALHYTESFTVVALERAALEGVEVAAQALPGMRRALVLPPDSAERERWRRHAGEGVREMLEELRAAGGWRGPAGGPVGAH